MWDDLEPVSRSLAIVAWILCFGLPIGLPLIRQVVPSQALAHFAIYLPTFFMTAGALPFWDTPRAHPAFQSALRGINAAVVGILTAALSSPVWTSGITRPADFALELAAFGLRVVWKLPPWIVVVLSGLGGQALAIIAERGRQLGALGAERRRKLWSKERLAYRDG